MRKTSVLLQCWCDVGRSSERRKSAQLQVLHEQLFGAFVRSFCTGLAIPCDRPTTAPILEAGLAAFSPPPSHPTLFLMLIVFTAHHFHASNSPWCAGPSISRLGEVSRTILHGICARVPPAADVGTPPARLARRPARCSRPASATAADTGSGVGRLSETPVRLSQVPCRRQRPW